MKNESLVVFQPSGIRSKIPIGENLLDTANELGESIESLCGGHGVCGKCKIKVLTDRPSEPADHSCLSDLTDGERKYLSPLEIREGIRLACRTTIERPGDVYVLIPESSRRGRQVIHKGARDLPVQIAPAVAWYHVHVPSPTLDQPVADATRLVNELGKVYNLNGLTVDRSCLERLPLTLAKSRGDVTALVWQDREVIAVSPGFTEKALGIAVDIGTTTVAAYLTDLWSGQVLATEAMMNPQVARGEDVMTRLSFIRTRPEGLEELHRQIIDGLNEMIERLCDAARADTNDILDMVVVGNTAMHHILLRLDPSKLAVVPFPPVITDAVDIKVREIGIKVNPGAYLHLLPIEAGFVGADNVAVLIAEQPHLAEEITLVMDIGTNGEILLGNRERLMSASCACGPAFEGAHITHGMRAMPGAIEKVRIDPETYAVSFRVIGHDRWCDREHPPPLKVRGICGSGVVDAVAQMLDAGLVDASGRLNPAPVPGIMSTPDGQIEFILVDADLCVSGRPVTVTAGDVRAIQNAKAALSAGASILMEKLGITRPQRVILAGAFGMHLDVKSILRIGLIPQVPEDKVYAVGNAAGDGARLALLSREKREEARKQARRVEYVELSADPSFNEQYITAMMF